MSSPAPTSTGSLSRRERQRLATLDEIKTLARRQLAEAGPGALSLRAIAREMGIASSALYRYFANYHELVSALCIDAYDAVADALTQARDTQPADDPTRQWSAICHGYRRWSLDHPADFALIFGTPIPGYQAPPDVTSPAAGRFTVVALDVFTAAIETGAADPDRTPISPETRTGDLWGYLLGEAAPSYPPRLAGLLLNAFASLRGYLMGEVLGSLSDLVDDPDQLFQAHLHTLMLGMGFDPAVLVETLAD